MRMAAKDAQPAGSLAGAEGTSCIPSALNVNWLFN